LLTNNLKDLPRNKDCSLFCQNVSEVEKKFYNVVDRSDTDGWFGVTGSKLFNVDIVVVVQERQKGAT
jgi:hypothetical protein